MSAVDYAAKLYFWMQKGFPELGDLGGMGIGATTIAVLRHENYKTEPHKVYLIIIYQ